MSNVQHYMSAVLKSLRNGSFPKIATRYYNARRVDRAVAKKYGMQVQKGPFKGMNYIEIPPYKALPGKLLGFYEVELIPAIQETLARFYDVFINVGSAEGYYTVGYARAFPKATIIAFDIDPRQQAFCRSLATVNNVADRIQIRGECTVESLQEVVKPNSLIFMDCEGCEFSLLKPDLLPALSGADIIVELHDFGDGTRKQQLKAAFEPTHTVTEIQFVPRRASDYPEVQFLGNQRDKELAVMDRDVPSQSWFYIRAARG
ncbi:MAG: hypothetical protein ABI700_21175 [Chloroflexota bacterium]